ncbi:NnrU family protein [Acidimangrovimonas sediminis]|uniref:NnrU family protein n=1 Tax=Acidimangrovimonas sediminis TaxID=2056283 RepID=UPI000C80F3F8|nr:NnrU family protein [Acidimangrovimonas sediminis]
MAMLVLGVVLWWAAHLFKRLAPGARAGMGPAGRGIAAVVLVVALVLMVIGFRAVPAEQNLVTIPGNGHINNLLMLIAVIVFGAGMSKGVLWTKIRHPMLWGVILWSVAHLFVHNDPASLVLFGGMGLWAIVEMAVINAAGPWARPTAGAMKRDIFLVIIAIVMYAIIVAIHVMFGLTPNVGTIYG